MIFAIIIVLFLIILSPLVFTDSKKKAGGNELIISDIYNTAEKNEILEQIKDTEFIDPIIDNIPGNLNYRNINNKNTYRVHIGQRKLLLNEVLFLAEYGHLSKTVVYAGAAPGIHIPLLLDLFPEHKFILWDPAPFAIVANDRMEINNEYFTHDSAKKYNNVLFISDIRSADDNQSYEDFEKEVEINNIWQMEWVKIIQAPMAMLKFRIPFTVKSDYEYLAGKIYLQPWAPIPSAETRLITDGKTMTKYNPVEYENKMFYLNNIIREYKLFKHDIPTKSVPGLCYCFDCKYEIWIWQQYFKFINSNIMSKQKNEKKKNKKNKKENEKENDKKENDKKENDKKENEKENDKKENEKENDKIINIMNKVSKLINRNLFIRNHGSDNYHQFK